MTDDYDAAKDAHDSYYAAIEAKRVRGDSHDWEGRPQSFLDGRVTLHPGDCLDVLAGLPENSVDSVVTDPPYHLTSGNLVVDWTDGRPNGRRKAGSAGFMGKTWDGGDIAFRPETWAAVLRVMKPGAHLLAFSATRTYHRMVCAIEDAGFEIRDQIAWVYGSGFPKSHDVSKGIDRMAGAEREVVGPGRWNHVKGTADQSGCLIRPGGKHDQTAPATDAARQWQGWGSALKPALEPLVICAKPVTIEQHFAIIVSALTELIAELAIWSGVNVRDAAGSFSAIQAKSRGAASSVLDGAKISSLESIGFVPSAEQGSTSRAPAFLGPTRTRASSALSHVRANISELGTGERTTPHGRADDLLIRLLDMSMFATAGGISANIVSSWGEVSDAILSQANRFTIETATKLTIALRTLKSSLLPITSADTGSLSPNLEPIVLARKPLTSTIAGNVLKWGTGAINIDGCRIEASAADVVAAAVPERSNLKMFVSDGEGRTDTRFDMSKGRFPANLIHDGSEEVLAAFPETDSGGQNRERPGQENGYFDGLRGQGFSSYAGEAGSAARFFYSAKADATDRIGSKHPTVKPLDLMQYLCRLITPPGGTVLDLFAGTGTTGEAAWREGFNAILIEREPEYQADIARRMDLAVRPTKRAAVAKTKGKLMGAEGTPLFGDEAA